MKYTENECSCSKCQDMCKTPCIGTPDEMIKLMYSGYGDRILKTGWGAGIMLGTHEDIITIVAPQLDLEKGYCTFFDTTTGLCELHDKGLKPTEGRFASCKDKQFTDKELLFETPLYKCISEWEKLKLK